MRLDVVVAEVERAESLHISDAQLGVDVKCSVLANEAAAGDLVPGFGCEMGEQLIGLSAKNDVAAGLTQSRSRCCGAVRANGDLGCAIVEGGEPLDGHSQLRWR